MPVLTPAARRRHREAGATIAFVAVSMVALLSMAALVIDAGLLMRTHAHLQAMADAAALAAAQELPSPTNTVTVAQEYADYHDDEHGTIVAADEVVVGNWAPGTGTFTPAGAPVNAVRVIARRTAERNNAVPLFLAKIFGVFNANVSADATAIGGGTATPSKFLVDEELIDSDIIEIIVLAASLGKTSDEIIRDNNGDWYIDMPVGAKLQLPTGQTGDQGLFEIQDAYFPFTDGSSPSFTDFLNWTEHIGWRAALIPKSMLDPLTGVHAVNTPAEYPPFVNPGVCQVSPIYKSDVNAPPPPDNGGAEEVKALGERRGLLAFSLDSLGTDPDGPGGSKFPNVWITVCPPVTNLDNVGPGANLKPRLVQ